MADDITIDYSMNPAGYLAGAQQVAAANTSIVQSFAQVTTSGGLMNKALEVATPKRVALAGWTALSAAAAGTQQAFSTLEGQSAITGTRFDRIVGTVNQLSRQLPLGSDAIRGVVEQFSQMGVVGAGTEEKVGKLTKTVANLSGVTGEGPAGLAQGMTELARATGNTNLDPTRFANMADSLTKVSLTSGASAGTVLAFSRNIAPMAQAAGIGTTGILGISTAFARLGEDGVGANTAVNKMLSDMSKAVRDGGPELKTYAEITGQTVQAFTALAKSNPAEALTQVTESIAKSGNRGPQDLERLGLDGVRTMRSLTALTASGGLRPAIAAASSGYGSGDTQAGAEKAFSGLNDQLTMLTESSKQVAVAFGAPLLQPLTMFAEGLNTITGGFASAAGSKVGQGVLTTGMGVGAAALTVHSLVGPLATALTGNQVMTSGPLRSLAAGFAGGTSGFLGRYGAGATALANEGTLATSGMLGGVNQRAFTFGDRYRQGRENAIFNRLTAQDQLPGHYVGQGGAAYADRLYTQQEAALGRGGPGVLQRLRTAGREGFRYANVGAAMMSNQLGELADNSRLPFNVRKATMGLGEAGSVGSEAYATSIAGGNTRTKAATDAVKAFHTEITSTTKGIGSLRGTVDSTGHALAKMAQAGGSMISSGATNAVGAAGGVGNMLKAAGPMLGLTAGIVGIGAIATATKNNVDANQQTAADYQASDISKTLNAYKESIGKATDASRTVGSVSAQFATEVSKGVATYARAADVTAEDQTAASGTKANIIQHYIAPPDVRTTTAPTAGANYSGGRVGNPGTTTTSDNPNFAADIAAQVAAINPGGLAPDELQSVKVDLLRQFTPAQTKAVMAALPASVTGGPKSAADAAATPSMDPKTMDAFISGISSDTSGGGFWKDRLLSLENMFSAGQDPNSQSTLDQHGPQLFGPGGAMGVSTTSDAQRSQIGTLSSGFVNVRDKQSQIYGDPYAQQTQLDSMQQAINSATTSGASPDTINTMMKVFSGTVTPGGKALDLSVGDLAKNKGDVAATIAAGDPEYAKQLKVFRDQQAAGGGAIKKDSQPGIYGQELTTAGSPYLGHLFDNQAKGAGPGAIAAALAQPSDATAQASASKAIVSGAGAAGLSLNDLAKQLITMSGTVGESSTAFKQLLTALGNVQLLQTAKRQDMSPGASMIDQFMQTATTASMAPQPQNPTMEDARKAAQPEAIAEAGALKERLKARLSTQREYNVALDRMNEDAGLQVKYTEQDNGIQRQRTIESFNRSQLRQVQDYNKSVLRAHEDFNIQRARSQRDYDISMARSTEDYNISRARTMRDFNISMARTMADAAKTIYDPYSRVQTKATWDAKNLLSNLGEQTIAIQKQVDNLAALRKAGVSDASITMLDLTNSANAQQAQNLVNDLGKDPSLAGQLNAAGTARQGATTSLTNDASNTTVQRAKEDLTKSLGDTADDRARAIQRGADDLSKSFSDQNADFAKSLARGDVDFNLSIQRSNQDLNIGLAQNDADLARGLARQATALNTSRTRMAQDLARSDTVITDDFKTLAEQTSNAIAGRAVDWNTLIVGDMDSYVKDIADRAIPALNSVLAAIGLTAIADLPQGSGVLTGKGPTNWWTKPAGAEGGSIPGSSPHPKADNINIWATAGEFMQPVATVKHYGVGTMEKIRTKQIPKEALEGYAEGGQVWPTNTHRLSPSYPGHSGVDIAASMGAPIYAPLPGQITYAGWDHGYGQAIFEQFASGLQAVFGHTSKVIVAAGQVIAGQLLGQVGSTGNSTGPHLHFEINSPGPFGSSADRAQSMAFLNGSTVSLGSAGSVAGGGTSSTPSITQEQLTGIVLAALGTLDQSRTGLYGKARNAAVAKAPYATLPPGFNVVIDNNPVSAGPSSANAKANQEIAKALLGAYGWDSDQMPALINLWNGESGWNEHAKNSSSGAYGIPQALPGNKMATVGKDWQTNPSTQIRWGMGYLKDRYGSPSAALSKWSMRSPHWYDDGGMMAPGAGKYVNATGKPEAVLTNEQWSGVTKLADQVAVMVSRDQGKSMRAAEAGGLVVHNHHESITYDSRNDFGGSVITVQSQDPDDMAEKLAAKKRRFRVGSATVGASR